MADEAAATDRDTPEGVPGTAVGHVKQALRGLQFGEVKLVVQDGVVVQVERTERKRLARPGKQRS